LVTVSFTAADTDVEIRHGLGFVPQNYFVVGCSAAMNVYDGSEDATSKFYYLRSDAIGTARVFLF
jgi:predicted secreted protein